MRTNFEDFLCEYSKNNNSTKSQTNNLDDIKKGDKLYYQNEIMPIPKIVTVTDVDQFSQGEIVRIYFKLPSDNIISLLPNKFNQLSKQKQEDNAIDSYYTSKEIESEIGQIVGYTPNQIYDLISFIKKNKTNAEINITFSEEVKDGRTPKFNINDPEKLVNITIILNDRKFGIKINSVKYINKTEEPSDFNQYIRYNYIVDISKIK